MPQNDKPLERLETKQVAEILHVTTQHVLTLRARGELKAENVGERRKPKYDHDHDDETRCTVCLSEMWPAWSEPESRWVRRAPYWDADAWRARRRQS